MWTDLWITNFWTENIIKKKSSAKVGIFWNAPFKCDQGVSWRRSKFSRMEPRVLKSCGLGRYSQAAKLKPNQGIFSVPRYYHNISSGEFQNCYGLVIAQCCSEFSFLNQLWRLFPLCMLIVCVEGNNLLLLFFFLFFSFLLLLHCFLFLFLTFLFLTPSFSFFFSSFFSSFFSLSSPYTSVSTSYSPRSLPPFSGLWFSRLRRAIYRNIVADTIIGAKTLSVMI